LQDTLFNWVFVAFYTSPGQVIRVDTSTFTLNKNVTTTAIKEIYWRKLLVQPNSTAAPAGVLWLL
jgi:hypothetical protein